MVKRILAAVATVLLLIPSMLQAATTNPEDFAPANSMVTADFSFTGRLKAWLEPYIREELARGMSSSNDANKAKTELLVNKLLSGDRFFASFGMPQNLLVAFQATDEEAGIFTAGAEKTTYEATDVYTDGEGSYTKLGGYFVIGLGQDSIHQAIDLATGKSTDSLSTSATYKKMSDFYLSPRLVSFTFNIKELSGLLGGLIASELGGFNGDADSPEAKAVATIMELIDLFEYEGFSLAEVSDGYTLNGKLIGNTEKLAAKGISLNPGGSFTPNLYKKFPNAKPLLYAESFNPKANNEQSKKIMEMLTDALGEEGENFDFYAEIKKETGLDIDEIYNALDKELAFGMQYDQNSPLPYFTLMANVSGNKAAGEKLVTDLAETFEKFLKDEDAPKKAYTITKSEGFTEFSFDLTKMEEGYDGPPFPKVDLNLGVTTDGLLVISNYPGIEDASKRTGFTLEETGTNTGIFYLNMRNAWGWMDAMLEWGERAVGGENGPPLDFYQGYYSALDFIYGWKDALFVSSATESEAMVTMKVRIDQAKHKSYEQLISGLKEKDTDGDGQSDYDERYIYYTPVDTSDSDGDGTMDYEELQKGFDPNKADERLFDDVSEEAYYTDEVGFLYQRGAISGYEDGTFQPGKFVNRAEFTTMVVKSFEQGTSNYLGVDVELSTRRPPFSDIDSNAWYYSNVAKAYSAGFISGSADAETGRLIFRPGDNITRAEALAILNKASDALGKSQATVTCADSPFDDVGDDDWFCGAVANGYKNGITKGKSAGVFAPNENIVRGDAAVMIRRTLEKDLEHYEEGTDSFEEFSAPLAEELFNF